MDQKTIRYLNNLNREFYQTIASTFDQTRQQAWQGWDKLLPYIQHEKPFSVLDVGCGNGRFGVFLADTITTHITYHGIDSSAQLLEFANQALANRINISPSFEQYDIIENHLPSRQHDLVVLFGVLHHIPGMDFRLAFIQELAQRVKPRGNLVFACWRFYEYERFRKRIIEWDAHIEVETHDYLLDWQRGKSALRYCHYVNDEEHTAIVAASGLDEVIRYRADGNTRDANCYSILQKQ